MVRRPFKKKEPARNRQPVLKQSGRSKPAFSYYSGDLPRSKKKDVVRERQASEKRHVFADRLKFIPTVIVMTVILLGVVINTTLSTSPTLVFAGGASPYRSAQDYKLAISKILESSLSNQTKLTINTKKNESSLLAAFPELDVATITLPVIGRRPTVTVHVRQPALILTTTSSILVLDRDGKVVAESKQLLSSVREPLLTLQDQSGLALGVGSQALSSDTVAFILNAVIQLKDKKYVITQATLPTTPNEVDFHLKDLAYYIKTDSTGDARLQIGAFVATKGSGVTPSEYMDLRVEEKVFYK